MKRLLALWMAAVRGRPGARRSDDRGDLLQRLREAGL